MRDMLEYSVIKEQRLSYGISQIKLAQYCSISPALISSWELNKATPTEEQLSAVYKKLQELIFAIEHQGLNIKKKRIQTSQREKKDGNPPAAIKTANEYSEKLEKSDRQQTEYTHILSEIYRKSLKPKEATAPKAISLFSGCGGLDLGFSAAGFDIVGHVEIEPAARKIYEANFPHSVSLANDVCSITQQDIDLWTQMYGNIDVLIGGPPCQGFSLAGKRDPNDIRSQLYKDYVKIVGSIRPKVFVMENVRLLTSMKTADGSFFIDHIMNEFSATGYAVSIKEINAQDYGVPQSRERVIIIGVRNDIDLQFSFPSPTFSDNSQMMMGVDIKPYRTFRYATQDLKAIESGEKSSDPLHWSIVHPNHVINWLKDVPEGCSAHENADPNLRPSSGFNTTYKRIVWDEPCSTISTNFSMISGCRNVHPSSTRSLTIREATRAQSFPDEFIFLGKWGDVRKAIGNAVPPLLAYSIAQAIKNQLL